MKIILGSFWGIYRVKYLHVLTSAMPSHLLLVFRMRNAFVFTSRRLIVSSMKRSSCLKALSVGSPDRVSEKCAATGPLVL